MSSLFRSTFTSQPWYLSSYQVKRTTAYILDGFTSSKHLLLYSTVHFYVIIIVHVLVIIIVSIFLKLRKRFKTSAPLLCSTSYLLLASYLLLTNCCCCCFVTVIICFLCLCVCVCVCVRERERERTRAPRWLQPQGKFFGALNLIYRSGFTCRSFIWY